MPFRQTQITTDSRGDGQAVNSGLHDKSSKSILMAALPFYFVYGRIKEKPYRIYWESLYDKSFEG